MAPNSNEFLGGACVVDAGGRRDADGVGPENGRLAPGGGHQGGGVGRRHPHQTLAPGHLAVPAKRLGFQVWSLSGFEVSCQLLTNDLSQVSSETIKDSGPSQVKKLKYGLI